MPIYIKMNLYEASARKKYGRLLARAQLYYIKSNETVGYVPDNKIIDIQREWIEEIINAVLRERNYTTLSFNWRFCDYEGISEAKENEL